MRTLRLVLVVTALVVLGTVAAGCGNLIGVGGGVSCVVQSAGDPNCFGGNGAGQAGRPASATALPGDVALPKGYGAADLSVGQGAPNGLAVACAAAGKSGSGNAYVWCWGDDTFGLLGRGAAGAASAVPVRVDLGAGRTSTTIAVGGTVACALTSDGDVCWGTNSNGQLGAAAAGINAPAIVAGTAEFRDRDGGTSTPSLLAAGTTHVCSGVSTNVVCWGGGASGQLGNGASADSAGVVKVAFPKQVAVGSLAAGGNSTCAIATDRAGENTQRVWCWGALAASNVPTEVVLPDGVTASTLSVGGDHACTVASDSTVWCWGANGSGQLGNGTTTASAAPVQVRGLAATLVGAGQDQTCASTTAGRLACWGANTQGQLGSAPGDIATTPRTVQGITGLRAPVAKAARVKGSGVVGSTLTAKTAAWPFAASYSYAWQRRCGNGAWDGIDGAKQPRFKVPARLAGCSVRAEITGVNAWTEAGVASSASRTSAPVAIAG